MDSKQAASILGKAIYAAPKKVRVTQTQKRREVADAQIAALQAAIDSIRARRREMPAWAAGYDSAVTAIEMQIAGIRDASNL